MRIDVSNLRVALLGEGSDPMTLPTAHTDIASMSSSPCRLVRIILGSGTSAKCSSRLSRTFSLIVAHSASCLRNLSLHARPVAALSASRQTI